MIVEDARPKVQEAVDQLIAMRTPLGLPDLRIRSVADFLEEAKSAALTLGEKQRIIDQAIVLLEEFYAHLPFKRVRYAVDPVQRLRLIRADLEELDDLEFHGEVVRTFARLRDPHTFYALPKPFSGSFAFLPFRMQHYFDEQGKMRFLVTHVIEGFVHDTFTQYAEVTHYNGMPIEEAVWRETGFDSAGNEDAQFIRGLNSLFGRALDNTAPREEHWAVVQYKPLEENAPDLGILLPWNVMSGFRNVTAARGGRASIFTSQLQTDECRKALWGRKQLEREKCAYEDRHRPATAPPPPVRRFVKANDTPFPAHFSFTSSDFDDLDFAGDVKPASLRILGRSNRVRRFGYLRIHSFNLDSEPFLAECKRILGLLNVGAGDGLILDVRSNPGGNIESAESLLQMLTPREVHTAYFHFMNSRTTREIGLQMRTPVESGREAAEQQFSEWRDGLVAALAEGSTLTPGRPLTSYDLANDTGQIYQGPVVLLVDALSYSATDIFAGGFEDNEIGTIFGVDRNTGGGGANRWLYNELRDNTRDLTNIHIDDLPLDANFGVAIRRTTRVGKNLGTALEDVGVSCQETNRHKRTQRDLVDGDHDLIQRACRHLRDERSYWLRFESARVTKDAVDVDLSVMGIDRIECFLDGFPQSAHAIERDRTLEASNTANRAQVSIPTTALARKPSRIKIKGYALKLPDGIREMKLVAAADFLLE